MAALEEGQKIHATVVCSEWQSNVVVQTALINMYGKCGSMDDARAVFIEMPLRDVISWNAMMAVSAQNRHCKETLQLLIQMQAEGFEPDKVTFICVLDACATVASLEMGQEIHAAVVGRGWEFEVILWNALINIYGKCRSLDDARAIFAEMLLRDVISWNAVIAACCQNGHGKEALRLFNQMQAEGLKPDGVTFICVLDACASVAALEEGQEIHATVVGNGCQQDINLWNALINMYGKCGSLDDARAVFVEIPQRDVVSWSVMLVACAQNGHGKEALGLFGQMEAEGVIPDDVNLICVLDACASVAALEEGRDIHATVAGNSWELDIVVWNALINMYGKCGSLDDARNVFAEMPVRDVVSWNALMASYAQNGHGKEALHLLGQMQAKGVKPDKVTFICVLTACSHAGLVDDGRRYFASISIDYRIAPLAEHYVCMVDLLGRGGLLDEAENLIMNMPLEDVTPAWLSLLSSCRIHSDVERAVRAANLVFGSDLRKTSPYVLLANIFADAGRSDGALMVRKTAPKSKMLVRDILGCFEYHIVA